MSISSNDKINGISKLTEFDEISGVEADCAVNSQEKNISYRVEDNLNGPTNKAIISPVIQLHQILKCITRGTQTPLILVKTMAIKSFIEENEILEEEFTINVTQKVSDVERTELSSNGLLETTQDKDFIQDQEYEESAINVTSFLSELRTGKMSVKFSYEAATQATPPYPSLTSAESSPASADILQTISSECSNGSLIKSELLTLTTDYGNGTPDVESTLVDSINQDYMKSYDRHDRGPSIQQSPLRILQYSTPSEETRANSFPVRRSPRLCRWICGICIRHHNPPGEETSSQRYGRGPPPTYSSVFTEPRSIFTTSRPPVLLPSNDRSSFIAPIPPPSYNQAQGINIATYSMDQLISASHSDRGPWFPRPTPAICPRCAALVVTVVDVRRSAVTHVATLVLFLFGCWPCCLIPYCVDSCKSTHHYCPVCRTYLGTYSPW